MEKEKGWLEVVFFSSESDMVNGMRHLHANARSYDENSNVVTIPTTETIIIKLDAESKVKAKLADKAKNIPAQSKEAKELKPVVARNSDANGLIKNDKRQIGKEPKNGHSPSDRTSTLSANKAPIKPLPIKPKSSPIDGNKKQLTSKPKTVKPATPRRAVAEKSLPPLKEVEKTPRVSTRTKQNRRPPIQKETRKQVSGKNLVDIEREEPPRIQPRSEEHPRINWWWVPVIALAALLLYGLFKLLSGFMVTENTPPPVTPIKKEVVKPVEKITTLLGPTATELGFEKGSLSARIADFLSLPASVLPKTFLLDKVHFASNREGLTIDAQEQLDKIVQLLKAYPTLIIQINGHTDNVGNATQNIALSENRAIIVKEHLKTKGVGIERIKSKGFGAERPIKSNQTEEGRKANRRSEIILLKR